MLFDVYRTRLSTSDDVADSRAKWIEQGKDYFNRYAPQSPAFNHVLIDNVADDLLIISREQPTEKTIRAMPGHNFEVGQIVTWKNSHWLITQRDNDDAITVRGKIEQCNRQLKWQNPKTGAIISRWCTAKKPYYSNLEGDSFMIQSSREFKIQLPYDSESCLIDLYKRFMLEIIDGHPKVYKVSSVDQTTERYDRSNGVTGFLVLNVTQDLYNPETDNADLGICDYIEVKKENAGLHTPAPVDSRILYHGAPTIRYGGSAKKLVFEIDGVTNYDESNIEWTIDIDPSCSDKIIVDSDRNTARISASDYAELEGVKMTVYASDSVSGASSSIALEVIG